MKKVTVIGRIGWIIGIFFIVIILIGVSFMGVMVYLSKSNDAYKGDYETVLESSIESAPKALVVFQPSKSSASTDIANQLAKGLNDSGYEVTLTYPGEHLSADISSYSLIAFGSPVFGGKPSKAITGAIDQVEDFSGKAVILYSVGKLAEAPELDVLGGSMKGNTAEYTTKFNVEDTEIKQKAYDLGKKAGEESSGNQ